MQFRYMIELDDSRKDVLKINKDGISDLKGNAAADLQSRKRDFLVLMTMTAAGMTIAVISAAMAAAGTIVVLLIVMTAGNIRIIC